MRRRLRNALEAIGLGGPAYRLHRRWVASRTPEPPRGGSDGLPLPPARLRLLVGMTAEAEYFERIGRAGAETIRRSLELAGVELGATGPVLDFGCGCGRVARHWAGVPGLELHGCDYNRTLVRWCADNLDFMEARRNRPKPPLPYPDERFGLIYAMSVFTHLTEPRADAWLAELVRVLRPGGHLLLTTHGSRYRGVLTDAERAAFDRGEFVVRRPRMVNTNSCAAFHPRPYMERRLARDFDSVTFVGESANLPYRQDVYVAQRGLTP